VGNIPAHDGPNLSGCEAGAIRTVFGQRSIDIGQGADPRFEREVFGTQAVRIPGAVELLVVLPGNGRKLRELTNPLEDSVREQGVLSDDASFFRIQLARLV
jgi:hypothetical protein